MSTKAKKLKASDIPYEDNGLRYVVETASTGRSTCKRYVFVEEDNTIRYILLNHALLLLLLQMQEKDWEGDIEVRIV